MTIRVAAFMTTFGAIGALATARGQCPAAWHPITTGSAPSARGEYAMTSDTTRHRAVLFGGRSSTGGRLGDTWEWSGSGWTLAAVSGPPPRSDAAMAFDSVRGRAVLFGGFNQVYLSDTWEWDGQAWTPAAPAGSGPVTRAAHAMAYHAPTGRTILFGGDAGGTPHGDTWAWNGVEWSFLGLGLGPAARSGHDMAYDPLRQVIVLSGGVVSGPNVWFSDTWEWNGVAWELRGSSPGAVRTVHAMAFLPVRGRVVAFGGMSPWGTTFMPTADTLEWTGAGWVYVSGPAPAPRAGVSAAIGRTPDQLVLFGGRTSGATVLGDTWAFGCACYADCNADGSLTVADFGCFQTHFVGGDPYADCNADGSLTVADFGCFQTKFVTGCP